jgi:hypothetical protein
VTNLQLAVVYNNNYSYKIKKEGAEMHVIQNNKSKKVLNVESGERMVLLEMKKMSW